MLHWAILSADTSVAASLPACFLTTIRSFLSQAITGINSVVFYSTTIFGLAGFSQAIIGTSLVGAINVGATIVTSRLIDKTGRKILLLYGTYAMLVSLLVLSIVLICPIDETVQGVIAVLAVLAFVLGFAFGLGAGRRD